MAQTKHGKALLIRPGADAPEPIEIPSPVPLDYLNKLIKCKDIIIEVKTFMKPSNGDTVTYLLVFDEQPDHTRDRVNGLAMENLMPVWNRVGMKAFRDKMIGNFILMAFPTEDEGGEVLDLDMTLEEFRNEFSSAHYDWRKRLQGLVH